MATQALENDNGEGKHVWACMCVCVTSEEVKITVLGNLDINLPCHSYWYQLSLLELGIILFYLTQVSCPAQDGGHRKHSKHVLGRSREVKEGRRENAVLSPASWISVPIVSA